MAPLSAACIRPACGSTPASPTSRWRWTAGSGSFSTLNIFSPFFSPGSSCSACRQRALCLQSSWQPYMQQVARKRQSASCGAATDDDHSSASEPQAKAEGDNDAAYSVLAIKLIMDLALADAFSSTVKEYLPLAMKELDLRPRNILRYRYGLHSPHARALSLEEVGFLYGMKPERVRMIEGQAISTLRRKVREALGGDEITTAEFWRIAAQAKPLGAATS